jgi:hypothetical protein
MAIVMKRREEKGRIKGKDIRYNKKGRGLMS